MSDIQTETNSGFSPTRRTIVGAGGVALIAGITGISLWRKSGGEQQAAGVTKAPQPVKPDDTIAAHTDSTAVSFNAHLNQEFSISGPSGEALCKLVEITPETRIQGKDKAWIGFSILFEAKPGFLNDGGICKVSREGFEPTEIFLTPVGRFENKTLLQAAFSHAV